MQDASRRRQGNFARIAKFSLCNAISLHSEIFTIIAKISLHSEIFCYSEISCFVFLCTNDPVLVNFISTLTVIILFRIVWYFHLFVRLYKPFYEQFVT